MKMQWLIIYVLAVGSPVRAESDLLGIFDKFWAIQGTFGIVDPPCGLETPS